MDVFPISKEYSLPHKEMLLFWLTKTMYGCLVVSTKFVLK